jgi:hypothetical protein
MLTPPLVRTLRPVVYTIFSQLRDATLRRCQSGSAFCNKAAPQLRLHTALATGADQIGAICARSSGFFVRALLPFEPNEYRNDFAPGEERESFEQALAVADEIVALPGDRSDPQAAYVRVGQSLVEAADVMVAVWDGEEGRGPGGTADVVELALKSSVPVIHIDIDAGSDEVRVRALIGGGSISPSGASLHDPLFYEEVLRNACELGQARASAGGAVFELGETTAISGVDS